MRNRIKNNRFKQNFVFMDGIKLKNINNFKIKRRNINFSYKIFFKGWCGKETVCGWGSTFEHTKNIRRMLPSILKKYKIKSINDIGCGDLSWIKKILPIYIDYVGYDIYPRKTWKYLIKNGWNLQRLNIANNKPRISDLAICRDVLIHIPNREVFKILKNIKKTSKYLLATSFKYTKNKRYAFSNYYRTTHASLHHSKINLEKSPFNFSKPLETIKENYPNKYISVWNSNRLNNLR